LIHGIDVGDAGTYSVEASNSFGLAISPVLPLTIHCIDPAAGSPSAPFASLYRQAIVWSLGIACLAAS